MKSRGGARRAITAVARATGTIALNVVLPMWTEDNSLRGSLDRCTKHLEIMELIELFVFALTPEVPSIEGAEFTTGEMAKGLFGRGRGLRANGMNGEGKIGVVDTGRSEIVFGMADGSNGAEIGQRERVGTWSGSLVGLSGLNKLNSASALRRWGA